MPLPNFTFFTRRRRHSIIGLWPITMPLIVITIACGSAAQTSPEPQFVTPTQVTATSTPLPSPTVPLPTLTSTPAPTPTWVDVASPVPLPTNTAPPGAHPVPTGTPTAVSTPTSIAADSSVSIVVPIDDLGKRGDMQAIPALAERGLIDDNPHPRWRSLWALAAVERDANIAKPILLPALDDPDPIVVRNAAVALAFFGFEEGRPELLNGLLNPDDYRRWEAVFSLKEVPSPEVVDALKPLVRPENEAADNIRSEATLTLGRISGPEIVPLLFEVLQSNPAIGVRMRAAISPSRHASEDVAKQVADIMESETNEQVLDMLQDIVDKFKPED